MSLIIKLLLLIFTRYWNN